MNFLAHAFLSFNDPEVLTGNLISDFVKGKSRYQYRQGIQNGISLHRAIDHFTDTHPEISQAKNIFRPVYGLYSGAMVDVCMDYFLANDKSIFPTEKTLDEFTQTCYHQIAIFLEECPEKFRYSFSKMQQYNWLYNYQFAWGIEKSLAGLVNRAKYLTDYKPAFQLFVEFKAALQEHYHQFFPLLYREAKHLFLEIQEP